MFLAAIDTNSIYSGALVATVVVAGVGVGLVTVLFKTISAQKEYISSLERGKKSVEDELSVEKETSKKLHEQNQAEIKRLNARIDAIRDVPLQDIHEFMTKMGTLIERTYELLSSGSVKSTETHTIEKETKSTLPIAP